MKLSDSFKILTSNESWASTQSQIDELTVTDRGTAEVKNFISLKLTRPKVAENQPFIIPKKSVFNKIIGDNRFEVAFSSFCESRLNDVVSFAKNTFGEGGVNFSVKYQMENANIATFFPDFFCQDYLKYILYCRNQRS